MDFDSRQATIKNLLTCPLCQKLCREVTAIEECCHIFCRKCISKKITEENLHRCPLCKVDLGVAPMQKLKADYRWQSLRNSIKEKRRELIERGLIKPKGKQLIDQGLVKGKGKEIVASEENEEAAKVPSDLIPTRQKERSLSSLVSTQTAPNQTAGIGRRRSDGRKSLLSRRASVSGQETIEIQEDHHETSSNPVNISKSSSNLKPSKQQMSNSSKGHRGEPLEQMHDLLKPLECLTEGKAISKCGKPYTLNSFTKAAPSDGHADKAREPKGKEKVHITNLHSQQDDHGSNPVPSGSGKLRNLSRGEEKRPLIEDLNIPVLEVETSSSQLTRRPIPIWFQLVASDKQNPCAPLPELPSSYLMVKDVNMPASFIKTYLVRKLGLNSEDEVEVTMDGHPISPDMQLQNVIDMWVWMKPRLQRKIVRVGASAKELLMVLHYARKSRPSRSNVASQSLA